MWIIQPLCQLHWNTLRAFELSFVEVLSGVQCGGCCGTLVSLQSGSWEGYLHKVLWKTNNVKQQWCTHAPTTKHSILWADVLRVYSCWACWIPGCLDGYCLSRLRQRSLLWTDASSWLRRSWTALRSVWALPWPSWRRLRRLQMRARGWFSSEAKQQLFLPASICGIAELKSEGSFKP